MRVVNLSGVDIEVDDVGHIDFRVSWCPVIFRVVCNLEVGRDLFQWAIEQGGTQRRIGEHFTLRQYLESECRESEGRQQRSLDEKHLVRLFRALMGQDRSKTLGELLDGPAFISATLPKMEGQG